MMAEFTEREIKIVHAMHALINPALKGVPFEIRKGMIMATLKVRGFNYSEQELTDIIVAINEETKLITQNGTAFLGRHAHLLKDMGNLKLT